MTDEKHPASGAIPTWAAHEKRTGRNERNERTDTSDSIPVPGRRRSILQELPLLVALVVLWMMLWGSVSVLTVVTGIVVAIAVARAFYLPAVELSGRFNPWWFIVFVLRFILDLVVASFQVAFQAFSVRGIRHNAVVAVQLDTRSDFVMTLTAIAISLIPGSVVVEVDRFGSILYLHALGVRDAEEAQAVRDGVLTVERRLVRALGSREDLARISA